MTDPQGMQWGYFTSHEKNALHFLPDTLQNAACEATTD